jgi:hypothetical protein
MGFLETYALRASTIAKSGERGGGDAKSGDECGGDAKSGERGGPGLRAYALSTVLIDEADKGVDLKAHDGCVGPCTPGCVA